MKSLITESTDDATSPQSHDSSGATPARKRRRDDDLQHLLLEKEVVRVEAETKKLIVEQEKLELEKQKLSLEIQLLQRKMLDTPSIFEEEERSYHVLN